MPEEHPAPQNPSQNTPDYRKTPPSGNIRFEILETREMGDVLFMRVRGDWVGPNAYEICRLILERFKEHDKPRLFLDARELRGSMKHSDIYFVASRLHELGAGRVLKGAVLAYPANQDQDAFYETVAQNRGVPIRFFYDEKEAMDWISE